MEVQFQYEKTCVHSEDYSVYGTQKEITWQNLYIVSEDTTAMHL